MHDLAPLIYDLTIMLGVAAIAILLFQRIRQPVVLGYLVAGMIIGPHALFSPITETQDIQTLSELGVIFLMFSLGLEFSFHKLARVGFPALVTGFIEVAFMLAIGFATGRLMGWTFYDSLFLGAALSISSTTIIIKAIDELKLKSKHFAEVIFGILIVEDLLAIILLVGLSAIVVTKSFFSTDMLFAMMKLIMVVGGWFIVGYFFVPAIFRKIAKYISEETLTIVSVALCLFLVSVAAKFHYSPALGAFIMGSIMAETVLIHRIETLMHPIRDIFAAVFFISIGMLIDPSVIVQNWQSVLLITLVTVSGKIISTTLGPFLTGKNPGDSVRVGFGMAQIGEFSFIIVGLGVALGVTSNSLYPIIVAVSGITTFTTPYLMKLAGRISSNIENYLPEKVRYFLMNYSSWVQRATAVSGQQSWFHKVGTRLFLNGLLVAIIFISVDAFLFQPILDLVGTIMLANMIGLTLALIISSPFIWGMLYSYRNAEIPTFATSINPAITMIWLVTLIEISVLGIIFFKTSITIILFLILFGIYLSISFRRIEKSYHWFEKRFIANIQKKDSTQNRYDELAPWDTHLTELDVGSQSLLSGKTLGQIDIRNRYGVNIVAIRHGERVISMPRGAEMIMPSDKLIVLGSDKQIELFERALEDVSDHPNKPSFLDSFMIKSFLLNASSSLIGQSIRSSGIREQVEGQVVGLERKSERILSPAPDIIFNEGDLIFLVGNAEKLSQLAI